MTMSYILVVKILLELSHNRFGGVDGTAVVPSHNDVIFASTDGVMDDDDCGTTSYIPPEPPSGWCSVAVSTPAMPEPGVVTEVPEERYWLVWESCCCNCCCCC